jgi:hypothetical protein
VSDQKQLYQGNGKICIQSHFQAEDRRRILPSSGHSSIQSWNLGTSYIHQFSDCKLLRDRCNYMVDSQGSSSSQFGTDYILFRKSLDDNCTGQSQGRTRCPLNRHCRSHKLDSHWARSRRFPAHICRTVSPQCLVYICKNLHVLRISC